MDQIPNFNLLIWVLHRSLVHDHQVGSTIFLRRFQLKSGLGMSATQGKRVEKKEEERGRDELERKGKYLVSEGVFSSVRAIGNDFGPCERLQGGGKEW